MNILSTVVVVVVVYLNVYSVHACLLGTYPLGKKSQSDPYLVGEKNVSHCYLSLSSNSFQSSKVNINCKYVDSWHNKTSVNKVNILKVVRSLHVNNNGTVVLWCERQGDKKRKDCKGCEEIGKQLGVKKGNSKSRMKPSSTSTTRRKPTTMKSPTTMRSTLQVTHFRKLMKISGNITVPTSTSPSTLKSSTIVTSTLSTSTGTSPGKLSTMALPSTSQSLAPSSKVTPTSSLSVNVSTIVTSNIPVPSPSPSHPPSTIVPLPTLPPIPTPQPSIVLNSTSLPPNSTSLSTVTDNLRPSTGPQVAYNGDLPYVDTGNELFVQLPPGVPTFGFISESRRLVDVVVVWMVVVVVYG